MRMLSTPPRLSRWNCSVVGVAWGTTPQKVAGSTAAEDAGAPAPVTKTQIATAKAAIRLLGPFASMASTGLGCLRRNGAARAATLAALPDRVGTDRDRRERRQ